MNISSTDVKNIIAELVEEMSNEGVGYVYAKDRAKDPKSIPGEHWRIKFGSEKDLKKHGNSEMSSVNEMQDIEVPDMNSTDTVERRPTGRIDEPGADAALVDLYKGNSHNSMSENKISKAELKQIIRELVNETFDNKLNEIEEGKPLQKNKDFISNLIFRLKEGEYIWFSADKHGTLAGGYGIEKKVEGDEYVYKTIGEYPDYLEEEDIQRIAQEVATDKYANFYLILTIPDYKKYPNRYEDDQALGSYELNGPDRPEPQFENNSDDKEWSIRNHLGHEVGTVITNSDPIAEYATKVSTSSEKLRKMGYTAVEIKFKNK